MNSRSVYSDISHWASHHQAYDHQQHKAASAPSPHASTSSASPTMSSHTHQQQQGSYAGPSQQSYSAQQQGFVYGQHHQAMQHAPQHQYASQHYMSMGPYAAQMQQHHHYGNGSGYAGVEHMYNMHRNPDGSPIAMAHPAVASSSLPSPGPEAASTSASSTQASTQAVRSKRKQVKNACVNCQRACKKCDEGRPCSRCVKYGLMETCQDSARKERKRGVKRGPYKRRATGSSVPQPSFVNEGEAAASTNGNASTAATTTVGPEPGSSTRTRSPGGAYTSSDAVYTSSAPGSMYRANGAPLVGSPYDGNSPSPHLFSHDQANAVVGPSRGASSSFYDRRPYNNGSEEQKSHFYDSTADRSPSSTPAGPGGRPVMSSSNSYGTQLPSLSGSGGYGGQSTRPLFSPPGLGSGGSQVSHRVPYDAASFTTSTSYSSGTTTSGGSMRSPRTPGTAEYVHHPVPTTATHLPSVTAGAFPHPPQNSQSSFALHLPQRMRVSGVGAGTTSSEEQHLHQHQHQHHQYQYQYQDQYQDQQPQLVRSGYAGSARYPVQREAGPDDLAPIKREAQRVGPLGAA